jgi:hypothetical protein
MYLSHYMVPTALTMKTPVLLYVTPFGLGGVTDVSENLATSIIEGAVSRRQQSLLCVFLLSCVSSFLFFLFWLVFVSWTYKSLLRVILTFNAVWPEVLVESRNKPEIINKYVNRVQV